jgi:6,7-dimethyl-8-ribityllumazine synthase
MTAIKIIEGDLKARDLRFAIVAARFNAFIVDRLLEGALEALKRNGATSNHIVVARVPGAFDLPVVAKKLAATGHYHAVIALGAVIRGATPHFEYVSAECASGLTRASLDTGVPIAFGVLTTDNEEQAKERAGENTTIKPTGDAHVDTLTGNKGADAALCAIEMANLLRAVN